MAYSARKGDAMATRKTKQQTAGVELRLVPLAELHRWDRNPKDHDIGLLVQSLKTYGLVRPPALSTSTGKLLYGHGLSEALETMRAEGDDPPRRVQVSDDGEWLIPTTVVDLEEPLHEPYLVIDNRSTELGGWDHGVLPSILADIAAGGRLELTGFDADDLEAFSFWAGEVPDREPLPPAEISGAGSTKVRVIVVFDSEEERAEMLDVLGMPASDKVIYTWNEIRHERQEDAAS
jgi:hypothetical protein